MYYSDEVIAEVQSRNNIVDVVGQYVKLEKKGANYMCCCPFHNEKTPSLSVSPSRQMYKCFGCGEAGGVFTFLMKYENISFPEAVKLLADRVGMDLPEQEYSPKQKAIQTERMRILDLNKEAAKYYYYALMNPMGQVGYEYFTKRELSKEVMTHWGLGFAPGDGRGVIEHLRSKGYTDDEIIKSGLASYYENKGMVAKFWNRVMYPIFDKAGKVIGFGGRVMGDGEPKYLNSPESIVFDKSKNLYGLNFAKGSRKNHFILCEGYMDVIALHKAGFTEAVASLGTAFTEQQANILRRMADKVYLSYDSDGAGLKAATRAYDICRSYGLSVKVIDMKPYKDPDEFIKNLGAEEYQKRIDKAQNGFVFKAKYIEKGFNMSDPDERTKFHHELSDMLLDIEDTAERNNYIETIASEFSIPRDTLKSWVNERAMANGGVKKVARPESTVVRNKPEDSIRKSQQLLLSYLVDYPVVYGQIKDFVNANDFYDEGIHSIAVQFFEDLSTGTASALKLMNMFEDPEDQANVGRMFNERIEDLSAEETVKAITDVIIAVKQNSFNYYESKSGTDMDSLMKTIEAKKALEKIKRIKLTI